MEIRPEGPADGPAIDAVVREAFGSDDQVRLVHGIRRGAGHRPDLALVAVVDGEVVGYVMISGVVVRSAAGDRPVLTLSPLAVAAAHQRQGVGSTLVRTATSLAAAPVVLEGDPAYYGRFGFVPAAPHGIDIDLPSWAPPEAAQVLLAGDVPLPRGRLVFAALDELGLH